MALRAAAAVVAAAASFGPLAGATDSVTRDAFVMGTRVHLATRDSERPAAMARLDRGLAALEDTEGELSTWRDDSAISRLNRTPVGEAWQANPATCRMFVTVAHWQAETAGAFDPAIARLASAWGIHGEGRIPGPSEIARALAQSGFAALEFDRDGCRITRRADVAVDVGAFGKGEALDRAGPALDGAPWMIDLGGQVAVAGVWNVAVAHPSDRARPFLQLTLRDGSLSTSAGTERDQYVDGRRVGHILDPRTGRPAPFSGSVSVWHRTALVADILSTALYVMGPGEGLRWAEERGVAALYLVPRPGADPQMLTTTAFRSSVIFSEGFSGSGLP